MTKPPDFESAWTASVRQLRAVAMRAVRDSSLADDIVQEVAVRAFRGYPRFNGDCPVIAWLIKLLKHEISRVLAMKRREAAFDSLESAEMSAAPQPDGVETSPLDLRAAACAAVREGFLSKEEAQMVIARLEHDASWTEIATKFDMKAATCASHHSRAIPKLRTYLFAKRPESLGGITIIRHAVDAARAARRLTNDEAEAFERVVLRGGTTRGIGIKAALRSACDTVAQFIPGSGTAT